MAGDRPLEQRKTESGVVLLDFVCCFRSLKVKVLERKSRAAWGHPQGRSGPQPGAAVPAPSQFLPVTRGDRGLRHRCLGSDDTCGQGWPSAGPQTFLCLVERATSLSRAGASGQTSNTGVQRAAVPAVGAATEGFDVFTSSFHQGWKTDSFHLFILDIFCTCFFLKSSSFPSVKLQMYQILSTPCSQVLFPLGWWRVAFNPYS